MEYSTALYQIQRMAAASCDDMSAVTGDHFYYLRNSKEAFIDFAKTFDKLNKAQHSSNGPVSIYKDIPVSHEIYRFFDKSFPVNPLIVPRGCYYIFRSGGGTIRWGDLKEGRGLINSAQKVGYFLNIKCVKIIVNMCKTC